MTASSDVALPPAENHGSASASEAPNLGKPAGNGPEGMGVVLSISVDVEIVLGSVQMPLSKLMNLSRGSVIPLDRKIGEPVDVVVNGKTVALGEVVMLDEEQSRFGVCLSSVAGLSGDDGGG